MSILGFLAMAYNRLKEPARAAEFLDRAQKTAADPKFETNGALAGFLKEAEREIGGTSKPPADELGPPSPPDVTLTDVRNRPGGARCGDAGSEPRHPRGFGLV